MDKMDTIYRLIVKKRLALSQSNFYKAMAVVLIIFTLAGCTERIEIELDSTYARLSVEGYITTDTMAHWVRLTETTDYYNATPPPPVVDAIVEIDDGENIITLTEYDSKPGYYFTPDDYFGVPGRTYDLNIQLSEDINNKKNYTATSELKPVASLDSITIVYNPDFEGWEVRVFALDPPTEDFYSFQVYKNGILQSDTINEISITDDRFFNGSYLNGVPAYFMRGDDADIQPGDVITLKMGGITKDFFTFVAELRDETFKLETHCSVAHLQILFLMFRVMLLDILLLMRRRTPQRFMRSKIIIL